MACERRKRTGICKHHQCEYPERSGYECVDVITGIDIEEFRELGINTDKLIPGKCELSPDCYKKCKYN